VECTETFKQFIDFFVISPFKSRKMQDIQ